MKKVHPFTLALLVLASIAASLLLPATAPPAQAQTESVLYSFAGPPDAYYVQAGVGIDKKGNLYGASYAGGVNGCGAVYKVTPKGTETVLYSFACGADGANPYCVVPVVDRTGNIYGTTSGGGANSNGTVFKVTPSGTESVLYSFAGTDGSLPLVGVIMDSKGNLYGTTVNGGANSVGTVFKVTPTGTETVLHSFAPNGTDGYSPESPLARDRKGNLYGTTNQGGANGYGTVFKITPTGTETVLHNFNNDGTDGYEPVCAGMVLDKTRNIYGNTYTGGSHGDGVLYKLTPSGTETILHNFVANGTDGSAPFGNLAIDKLGNLYGATYEGGPAGYGTVYEATSAGVETILHNFTGNDGAYPYLSGVVRDRKGNLYGATELGGAHGYGTVYKVVP